MCRSAEPRRANYLPPPRCRCCCGAAAGACGRRCLGQGVYSKTALCHSAGIAGAPKSQATRTSGAARIAQGKETVTANTPSGFTGSKGAMPARGGNTKLTDEEVKAAVDFMADQSV
ncbi:MAG: c-type cytochrome [Simplicispira sp.]|nr:c-type cytochrome [Simplicispira sp.]